MTVSAVGKNDNSRLYTIVGSTAAGAAGGYALKWVWPLQKSEKDFKLYRMIINSSYKSVNKEQEEVFKKSKVRTPAQDMFIKMLEEERNGVVREAFLEKNKAAKVKQLGGEESFSGKELRAIIRYVDESSKIMKRQLAKAVHFLKKQSRPTVPFVVAGAGVGFMAGFAHNIFKTDIDA